MAFIKTKLSTIRPNDLYDTLRLTYGFNDEEDQKKPGILAKPAEPVSDSDVVAAGFFDYVFTKSRERAAKVRAEAMEQYARESAEEAAKIRSILGITRSKAPTGQLSDTARDAMFSSSDMRGTELTMKDNAREAQDVVQPMITPVSRGEQPERADSPAPVDAPSVDTRSNEMLDKAIQDVLETVLDSDANDSTDSADGGAAPSDGKGIMSREVDSREDAIAAGPEETIPPQIVFLNDSTTNKGSTERDVYQYAYEQGIKGDELQSFMSQVAHESSKFGRIKEAGYLETKVNDSWVERTPAQIAAKLGGSAERKAAFNALANNKTFTEGTKEQKNNMIFDILYDDQYRAADVRLGNTEVGDGSKYKGRGYIQLTGRDNYKVIGEDIGEDLENNPELMLDPEIAKRASVAWWKRNVRSQQPDYTNTTQITRLVNGRLTGLESRKKYFKRYGEKPTAPQVSLRPSARPDTRVASN